MQTAVEALDDDALFKMDSDDEEEGEFVMYALPIFQLFFRLYDIRRGNFADALGDDFLGLRRNGRLERAHHRASHPALEFHQRTHCTTAGISMNRSAFRASA